MDYPKKISKFILEKIKIARDINFKKMFDKTKFDGQEKKIRKKNKIKSLLKIQKQKGKLKKSI